MVGVDDFNVVIGSPNQATIFGAIFVQLNLNSKVMAPLRLP